MPSPNRILLTRLLFWLAIVACITPWVSPPIALGLGLLLGLTLGSPYPAQTKKATKLLLQISVVGLGFGIDLEQVLAASRSGVLFTIATIAGTLALGFVVGRMLGIDRRTTHLISSGTAICGGSAIAAVGPVLGAGESEMSVSLGTVFILNAVALFLFPAIGHALDLSQMEFGIWAAIAIHDTSSVVGAAASYGLEAQGIATTVKLARALWIVPLVIGTSLAFKRGETKVTIPWFIFFFLVASVLRTFIPVIESSSETIVAIARTGLTVTLFLIGAGLTRAMLKTVGVRPLVLGVLLWVVISVVSLWAVVGIL